MADNKEEAAPAEEIAAGPKMIMGMTIPVLILVVLNALVMLGGLGYIFSAVMLYKPKPILEDQVVTEITKKSDRAADAASASETFVEQFTEMTINLKGSSGGKNHYVTLEPAIECSNAACLERVKGYKAKIEDMIQTNFAQKSFTELSALETRFRLRHELIESINSFIDDGAVTNLYFTSFIVQ